PAPSHISQSWWVMMPMAASTMPPHQHMAETKPALRGPTFSSQPPQIAAEQPRSTKNSVYIQPRSDTRQSQLVVKRAEIRLMSAQTTGWLTPMARDSGSQNTLKP